MGLKFLEASLLIAFSFSEIGPPVASRKLLLVPSLEGSILKEGGERLMKWCNAIGSASQADPTRSHCDKGNLLPGEDQDLQALHGVSASLQSRWEQKIVLRFMFVVWRGRCLGDNPRTH